MTEEEFARIEAEIRYQHQSDLDSLIDYLRSKLLKNGT